MTAWCPRALPSAPVGIPVGRSGELIDKEDVRGAREAPRSPGPDRCTCRDSVPRFPPLELVQQRRGDSRPGRAERMPERVPAAVRVHVPASHRSWSPVSQELEHDRGKRLVDLDHGDVVPGEAGLARAHACTLRGCRAASGTDRRRRGPNDTNRARGSNRARATAASLATSIAAEPSTIELEFPAVTTPSALNAGCSDASFSSDVSRLGVSSTANSTTAPPAPTSTGTISFSNLPSSMAATARRCDSSDIRRAPRERAPTPRRSPRPRSPAGRSASARRSSR